MKNYIHNLCSLLENKYVHMYNYYYNEAHVSIFLEIIRLSPHMCKERNPSKKFFFEL